MRRLLECDIASRPKAGEAVSGDRAGTSLNDGCPVAVAVDGLGHGPEAARAAERALEVVRTAPTADVVALAQLCHDALRDTRGAALSVASMDIEAGTLRWLGVGNVEGRLVRVAGGPGGRHESLLLQGGVVGHELPTLYAASVPVRQGDLLLFATDGVEMSFADSLPTTGPCREIARRVLERHGRNGDDALVLVARYLGEAR